jgi:hypothetical protein
MIRVVTPAAPPWEPTPQRAAVFFVTDHADPAAEPCRTLGQGPQADAGAGRRFLDRLARAVVGDDHLHAVVVGDQADDHRRRVGVLFDVEQALADRRHEQRGAFRVERVDRRELDEPRWHPAPRLERPAVFGEFDRQRPLRARLR